MMELVVTTGKSNSNRAFEIINITNENGIIEAWMYKLFE